MLPTACTYGSLKAGIRTHPNRRSSSCACAKNSPKMPLDDSTIYACLSRIRAVWPTLDELPEGVFVMSLNQVQRVLEQEGLEAITPARIEGWREIAEGYLIPFYEASKATAPSSESSQP